MGHVNVEVTLSNPDGSRSRRIEAMVDTGATYTFLPAQLLQELGIEPSRTSQFQLANGDTIAYARGEVTIRYNGFSQVTPVIFAEDDAIPLIGVVTLGELELAVDPVAGTLIPATLRL